MNFLLKNLEISIREPDLIAGEKLLDEGKVTSMYESERNLWIITVDHFETEIQITPSRVKACSCECDRFLLERSCGHIAAALLNLRKNLTKDRTRPVSAPSYKKLTINAILDQAGHEELKAFIRHYAKRDRQFTLALKTRFAGAVPMEDSREKYRPILDSVIAAARKKNDRISVQGSRQIASILSDLLGQSADFMALGHFAEGWPVIQVILEKSLSIVNKVDAETNDVLEAVRQALDLIRELNRKEAPPELKREIWSFLIQECSRPVYRFEDLNVRIYDLLVEMADEPLRQQELVRLIRQEWKKRKTASDQQLRKMLGIQLLLFSNSDFQTEEAELMKELTASPGDILVGVETARDLKCFDKARWLAREGLTGPHPKGYRLRIRHALLQIALEEGHKPEICQQAIQCYLSSGDLQYYRICQKHTSKEDRSTFELLEQELKKQNDHRLLAELYIEENRFDLFAGLCSSLGDIDFLMQYDHHFIPAGQSDLYDLYTQLLENYLSNHIGLKPAQKILDLLAHLRKAGAQKLAEDLVAFIRERYPRRMELAMELMFT